MELTLAVRAMPQYKDIDILMLTTEAGADLKKQGKEAGIRSWIVKPLNGELINKVIDKLMAKKAA